MKGIFDCRIVSLAAVLCAITIPIALGQSPVGPRGAKVVAAGPRQPGGILRDELGVYLTIEGVLAKGVKIETGTLLVDTVDGKKLDKPIPVLIRTRGYPFSIDLPAKERCVFKGYESGEMIGVPPAIPTAFEEQGRKDVPMSPFPWRWRPYFVALIVVEPKGLALPKD
jgi:hypothetical protein